MQELQASSVNESDKVLEELLQQYMVSVILAKILQSYLVTYELEV